MTRWAKLFAALLFVLAGAAPASAWTHGKAPTAAVTCAFDTGTCTGVGGGSSLFTAATCNGSADDSPAFASFNSWAGVWQATHSGQIRLNWPAGATCTIQGATVVCAFNSNQKCPFIGIRNLLVDGGAGQLTISTDQLVSISGMGLHQDSTHSARTASANAGATCVSLITAGQASLFTAGNPVLMTGFDLQGIWATPQGFPPNPQFWDRLHVLSVDASLQCDGVTAGASVRFTSGLTYQYLSTWPNYNSGSAFQIDPGGPATLYVVDPTWDATVEIDNLTINYPSPGQVYSRADTTIYRNVMFTSGNAIPTEGRVFQAVNTVFVGTMEIDKINDLMITSGVTANTFQFQSSSVKSWQDTGSTFAQIQGSPLNFTGNGTTFTSIMKVGATSYGRSDSFSCTNCSVPSLQVGGINDNGLAQGVQNTYTMSGGVIKVPNGTRFTSVASNGGAAQLVVTSSAGWVNGQYTQVGGVGAGPYTGVWPVHIDDATHITLTGSTFSVTANGFVCSAGGFNSPNCSPQWGAPGTNIMFSGTNGIEAIGQVTGVTQDANFAYVATTGLGSTFPADVTSILTHPAPKFNCPGCTGADTQIASLSHAPTDAPLFSYQTYTFPGSIGTTTQPKITMWGALSELEFNVTVASTGAAPFHLSAFDNWPVYVSGATASYGPLVAAGTAGDRKISSAGVITCNGSPGACSGSDSLTTSAGLWFGKESNSGPKYTTAPSAGASTTVTISTNQGVVNP